MSNSINDLNAIYSSQIQEAPTGVGLSKIKVGADTITPKDASAVGQHVRAIKYEARKSGEPLPVAYNEYVSKNNLTATQRRITRQKLGLAEETSMPHVSKNDKKAIKTRYKGLFKKDLKGNVAGVNENLSNWREDFELREVEMPSTGVTKKKRPKTSDKSREEITDKDVNNKVIINPTMGELINSFEIELEKIGGTLVEMVEIKEVMVDQLPVSPGELIIQKRMAMLNMRLARKNREKVNKVKRGGAGVKDQITAQPPEKVKVQKPGAQTEDLDKYDRYKRMIRHKQDKYGKNIIGADYNLENERKAKGWKKKLNKEENEVKEDAASQVNRVLKGIEKDPRAQKSFEKSAKKRKGPGTDKDRAADLKFQSAIDAADTSKSDSSYAYEEVEFAVDYFYEQGINEDGLDLIIEEIGLDDFVEFVLYPDEELMEERAARKMNVKTKKKMPATIASDAEAESKRRAGKTGEYKETPKKKAKVGGPSYTTKVEGPVKKMEKRRADDDLAGAPVKKKVEKAVAKVKPIQPKKEVSKGGLRDKIDSLYKAGVKRHKKAVQPARVLGKGFVRGVKDTAKFAGKAKKALVGERFSNWRDEIVEGKGKDKEELVDVGFGVKVPKSKAEEAKKKMNASVRGENIPGFKGGRLD